MISAQPDVSFLMTINGFGWKSTANKDVPIQTFFEEQFKQLISPDQYCQF